MTRPAGGRSGRMRGAIGRIAPLVLAALAVAPLASGCVSPAAVGGGARAAIPAETPIRIGAVFPLAGNAAGLAGEELRGLRIAADLVNADGGIHGHPVELDVRDLRSAADAPAVMAELRANGASVVVGAYSSDLSVAASAAADAAGLVYWEAGAVADRVTGRGLPLVFRVGASGTNLGTNSATFAATELAPRLGKPVSQLRVAIVNARDAYATSVADAAARTASAAGMPVVARLSYDLVVPRFASLMPGLAAARPDVLILASHIQDGVDFRRAMLAAGLKVGAFIGSTMAQCDPDFAGELGPDAVGVFASDRPVGGFRPDALLPTAQAVYARFARAWSAGADSATASNAGAGAALGWSGPSWMSTAPGRIQGYATSLPATTMSGSSGGSYATWGPPVALAGGGPTEEAISGFSAAWALFADVLPSARAFDALSIAAAARAADLPDGSLPNGAGLRFSGDPATLGQNERSAAVIWQWQAVRSYAFVWPPTYATGAIVDVPLAR